VTSKGAMYKGMWVKDKNEGFCISYQNDGKIYQGDWKEDKWHGIGRLY